MGVLNGKEPVLILSGRPLLVEMVLVLLVLLLYGPDSLWAHPTIGNEGESHQIWNFDTDQAGTLPKSFVVGIMLDGRPAGEWQVIDMKQTLNLVQDLDRREHKRIEKVLQTLEAPSPPHVLAQLKNRGFEQDYHMVLVHGSPVTDFDLNVSFLPVAGKADMGGGLVWRARDAQNYYITRANPLEQNIRFYRVVKGVRYKLANFDHIISVNTWHTFRVVGRVNHFQIIFDGQMVFDVRDETFQSGRIGLWTKADAVTYFDDLRLSVVK
jgi:hypothetical protein